MNDPLFNILLSLQHDDFHEAVYKATALIPSGKVLGYGHLATLIGRPGYARHVGKALSKLLPEKQNSTIPWWRVLRSDGSIAMQGDPSRGPSQIKELQREGTPFKSAHVVNMKLARWWPEID